MLESYAMPPVGSQDGFDTGSWSLKSRPSPRRNVWAIPCAGALSTAGSAYELLPGSRAWEELWPSTRLAPGQIPRRSPRLEWLRTSAPRKPVDSHVRAASHLLVSQAVWNGARFACALLTCQYSAM